jgi:hypothetical protein
MRATTDPAAPAPTTMTSNFLGWAGIRGHRNLRR